MKVERYIKEYAAAILRDKHIDEISRCTVKYTLQARERGNLTAAEAMDLLYIAATTPERRLRIASSGIYYDTERDELVTHAQLRQEWGSMTEEEREERGGTTFDSFLENCMIRSNGVLMHFSEWIENRLK